MSDTFIPTGSSGSPAGFQPPDRKAELVIIRAAPVITLPDAPLPPRAEVVSQPPVADGQIRLRTAVGDIVISAPNIKLPAGTLVTIELDTGAKPPTVTLRAAPPAPALPTPASPPTAQPAPVAPPPPTVVTGEKVLAIVLNGSLQPPTEVQQPPLLPPPAVLLQQIAKISLGQSLPADLPLTSAQVQALVAAPDPEAFLKTLPLVTQEKLKAFLTQPNIQPLITAFKQQPRPAAIQPAQTPLAIKEAPLTDDPLITIPRPQIAAQTPATPQSALPGPLGSLFGFIQTLLGDSDAEQPVRMPIPYKIPQPLPDSGQNFAELTILRVTPPQQKETPLPLPANVRPEDFIEGIVIGKTSDGRPVIQTPRMDVVLHQPVDLPVNTKISMTAQPVSFAEFASRVLTAPLFILPLETVKDALWPALEEALSIIASRAPQAASTLQASLPVAGPKMVPTTLFFLAALRLGVIESWLGGPALQHLRDAGRRDLAEKIGGDFTRLSQQSRETLPGDWRGFSLPLMQDNTLQQLQFFFRHHSDDAESADRQNVKTTRFVVNVNLSRLGDLQLDGLLRKPAAPQPRLAGKLELIVRSDAPFDTGLQQDLRRAFTRGLEDGKLSGSLQFQANRQGWQIIMPSVDDTHMA